MQTPLPVSQTPLLLVGGHDPSGGAGLTADLEVCAVWRQRAYSLVSCLTVQGASSFGSLRPANLADAEASLELLAEEEPPLWCKAGLLPSVAWVRWLGQKVAELDLWLVLDPVLAAGADGSALVPAEVPEQLCAHLLPHTQLATPNRFELAALSGEDGLEEGAAALLEAGCAWVLVTGVDAEPDADEVVHWLFGPGGQRHRFVQPRLQGLYHGSGCTLASACACALARDLEMPQAVDEALGFTRRSLEAAWPSAVGGTPFRSVAP